MIHRHLEYPPETPAAEIPSAAIVDILERGDLDEWRPIAAAVARDPYGPFAQRVARLLDVYPMYGTSPLWRAWIDQCRAQARGRRATERVGLAALRRRAGLTQVELAERMGIAQSDLSKLERRQDIRLSTLEAYARAVGAKLHLLISFPEEGVEVDVGSR